MLLAAASPKRLTRILNWTRRVVIIEIPLLTKQEFDMSRLGSFLVKGDVDPLEGRLLA